MATTAALGPGFISGLYQFAPTERRALWNAEPLALPITSFGGVHEGAREERARHEPIRGRLRYLERFQAARPVVRAAVSRVQ